MLWIDRDTNRDTRRTSGVFLAIHRFLLFKVRTGQEELNSRTLKAIYQEIKGLRDGPLEK
jgi:hypothetical protein